MSDNLTFGINITANSAQLVGAVKESSAAFDGLKQSTNDVSSAVERQKSLWEAQQAFLDAQRDKAWALANGYKEVEGQLLKVVVATEVETEAVKTNSRAVTESLVLVREAARGNFSRMAGSASILANALGVLPAILSPVGLAMGAVAGATIGLAFEMSKVSAEELHMNAMLQMTGDFSGQTVLSMNTLAHSVAEAGNVTVSSAVAMETALVKSGRIGADAFDSVSMAAGEYARLNEVSMEKAGGWAEKIFSDPAKGAMELNAQLGFLSGAQMEHIMALDLAGEHTAAANELADKYVASMDKIATHESAWTSAINSVSNAFHDLFHMNEQTPEQAAAMQAYMEAMNPNAASNKRASEADLIAEKADRTTAKIREITGEMQKLQLAMNDPNSNATGEEITNWENAYERLAKEKEKKMLAPKSAPKNPDQTAYNAEMTELINLQEQAIGKTEGLTLAQTKLLEIMKKPDWQTHTDQEKINLTVQAAAASAAEEQRAAKAAADKEDLAVQNASIAARLEYEKIVSNAKATAAAQIEQLQFQNSLLGKNTLEVLQLTEAHKIELDLKQKLQALSVNPKFATRDTNAGVELEYQQSVEAKKAEAQAAKDSATSEIQSRYDVSRAWDKGGVDAINTYMESVSNAAAQSNKLFSDAFKGMEDAMVNFVKTGKLNFTSLADNIITDLLRIQVQETIMAPLSNAIKSSGGFSGLFKGLFNADGNAFDAGGVHAFADGGTFTNGIFDSPTAFKFADGNAFDAGGVHAFADGGTFTNGIFDSPTAFKFADGNAFDAGGVHAFADGGTFTNGIFDSPTAFKFADGGGFSLGIMGEAGSPEAVMPLTRGPDGKLGVSAQGNGNSSSVIVNQPLTINAQNASAETVARIRALMPMFIAENSRTVVGAVNQALLSRGQMPIRS